MRHLLHSRNWALSDKRRRDEYTPVDVLAAGLLRKPAMIAHMQHHLRKARERFGCFEVEAWALRLVICMYVSMCIYLCIHVCVCMNVYMYIYTYT